MRLVPAGRHCRNCTAEHSQCLVLGVSDGDTIKARCGAPGSYEQIRVHLSGLAAPERRQPFGARAKDALTELVMGKQAPLECVFASLCN